MNAVEKISPEVDVKDEEKDDKKLDEVKQNGQIIEMTGIKQKESSDSDKKSNENEGGQ